MARLVAWPALAVLLISALLPSSAGGQQALTLSVGARVAPACTVRIDQATNDDADPSGVRVQCGRSGLRVLRITTDRGEMLRPHATFARMQRVAGGEVAVAVPRLLGTVAGRLPVFAMPAPPGSRPVVITFDF